MEQIIETVRSEKYASYKDSCVEFIGDIPVDWHVVRGTYVFEIVDERSKRGEETLLSVSEHHGVKPRSESNVNMFMAESYVGYKICCPGDLVINSLWAWSRGLGFSKYKGIVSTAYSVFRPNNKKYNEDYLNYLLRTEMYVAQYLIFSKGIWISRLSLSDWSFLRLPILSPPRSEQTAIANFLDQKTRQIDMAIAQKEKLIELLKERRQILLHRAVTKGLDKTVQMKDSGVEWIGKIPAHWHLKRLKFLGNIRYGLGQPPKEKSGGLPLIRATNVERGKILQNDLIYVDPKDIPWERNPELKENDIIVVRSGAYTADSAIIPKSFSGAIAGYDMVFSPDKIYAKFCAFSLLSKYVLDDQLYLLRMRAAQPHLNAEELGSAIILCPDTEAEQISIADYLEDVTDQTDKAISKKKFEIEKLKEYKTTLINSAVTGKIKVS